MWKLEVFMNISRHGFLMVLRQTRTTLTSLQVLSNAANADDAICVLPSSQALRLSPQNPPTLTRLCCADDHHAGTVPLFADRCIASWTMSYTLAQIASTMLSICYGLLGSRWLRLCGEP